MMTRFSYGTVWDIASRKISMKMSLDFWQEGTFLFTFHDKLQLHFLILIISQIIQI